MKTNKSKLKILSVVGARPNFMKVAPIIEAVKAHNAAKRAGRIDHVLVHTGQHYDEAMSDSFFRDLNMPRPDRYLGVGSASHAVQTAEVMMKFEAVLAEEKPDVVIVVGDVNSTVACALVATKLICPGPGGGRPLVAHVEAGLRSFDRTMPEELNRIVTDHLSDYLFVTEQSGIDNLEDEGIDPKKVHFVGNTMIDTLIRFKPQAATSQILGDLGLLERGNPTKGAKRNRREAVKPYALLTLHRPANVDNPAAFKEIIRALGDVTKSMPIVFPAHPRTAANMNGVLSNGKFHFVAGQYAANAGSTERKEANAGLKKGINIVKPLGYLDFLQLMMNASVVLTDSGGIQEETTCLGVPCITIRENTERPVTITEGTNILAGTDRKAISKAFSDQMARTRKAKRPKLWDGHAADRIVKKIIKRN
jgi:UDP-N-acetylglucosamine 2-epimerase (non-hydrolysing)